MKKMLSKIWVLFTLILFLYSIPYAAAGTVNYTYDDAGRLIKADYGGGKTIEYTYDKAGNLLKKTVSTAGGTSVPCDFNGDGKTDILWRNKSTGQNVVWLMNGTALSSYLWIDTVADTNWQIVGTGDFNGDGKTDILWRNKSTGQNVVWLMNGSTYSSYAELMQVADTNWGIVGPK